MSLAAEGRCKLFVYGAGLDVIHSPHADFWREAAGRLAASGAAAAGEVPPVNYTYLPGRTHWGVCANLYALGLHDDESLWHDTPRLDWTHEHGAAARPPPSPAALEAPRAKL